MKKIIGVLVLLLFAMQTQAQDVIYKVDNGTQLKCVGVRTKGGLPEYKVPQVVDYYTFKNNKIYSKNLVDDFLDGVGTPKKVKKLKISNSKITFKDRLYTWKTSNYKFVTIDRKTGDYSFHAKKQYNWAWYMRQSDVVGKCEIVE